MKKHINLFLVLKAKNYQKREKIFKIIKTFAVVIGVFIILSLAAVFFIKRQVSAEYKSLLAKKEEYLKALSSKQDLEKKVAYFNQKSSAFTSILNQDVNFLPYYNFLLSHMPIAISSDSAALNQINFDNQKNIKFSLNFNDPYVFLNNFEDFQNENFLKIFDELTLSEFTISEGNKAKETASEDKNANFSISFTGKLKPISNESIKN